MNVLTENPVDESRPGWSPPDFWLITALVIVVAAAFARSCWFPLLDDWDDHVYITGSVSRLRLSAANLIHWWGGPFHGFYIPLTMWSYMFDYAVWGLNGFGYHLQNVLWHIAAVLAVFKCFRFLGVRPWTAFIFCAVFAVHPQRAESVVWVSERKDVMCAAFFFWSVYFYLRIPRKKWPVGAFVLFLAAMLSKSMAISLPFVLLAYEFSRRRTWRPQPYLKRLWPFLAVSLFYIPFSIAINYVDASRLDPWRRIFVAAHNFFWYISRTLLPRGLSPLYPRVAVDQSTILTVIILSAVALTALWLVMRRDRGLALYGVLPLVFCYGITLAPVSGLVPLGAIDRADRYSYIPSAFLWFGLAWLWQSLAVLAERRWSYNPRRLLFPLSLAYLAVMLIAFQAHSLCWSGSRQLWTAAAEADENLDSDAHWFLGLHEIRSGNYAAAYRLGQFFEDEAKRRGDGGYGIRGCYLKGMALAKTGRRREAAGLLEQVRSAVMTPPPVMDAETAVGMLGTLAECHLATGDREKISGCFIDAAKLVPPGGHKELFYLGMASYADGDLEAAERHLVRALELMPGHRPSAINLEIIRRRHRERGR